MPTSDLEPLLAGSSWLHTLARSLAADPQAADDLVQDAWVAALERPPRDGLRLTRWLAVVVQNFARQSWRGEARRTARERSVVRDEAIESDDGLLERLELSRALAAEVAALAEPYRTVILLRYFEGLSPREIARRLDIPLRTVHTRLHRALAKLRAELQRDPDRWQLALLPITAVLSRGAERSLGALLVTTGTKVTVVVLALAGVVAWTVLAGRDASWGASPQTTLATTARGEDGLESDSTIELAPATREAATRSESLPAAPESASAPARGAVPATAHTLHVRVVDSDNSPVSGVRVCLRGFGESEAKPERCAISDARGVLDIQADGATGTLGVDDPAFTVVLQPQVFDPSEPREQLLVVARVAPLAGVVVDEDRTPLAGAQVRIGLSPGFRTLFDRVLDSSRSAEWTAVTDAMGRFEIPKAPAITAATLHTRLTGYEDDVRDLTGRPDWGLELVLGRMDDSLTVLTGHVVDPDRRPVEGAWVALGDANTRSDAAGAFTLGVQQGNEGTVMRAVKKGRLPAALARRGDSNAAQGAWPDPLVLELGAEPLSIRGQIVDADGAPVAHAEILSDDTTHFGVIPYEHLSFSLPATVESLVRGNMFANSVESDGNGRFELSGLLPRKYRLYAFDRKALIATLTDPIEAGSRDVVIRLPEEARHERIAGRVVSLRGEPVVGAEVALRRDVQRADGPDGALQSTVTNGETITSDAQGRFEFRGASTSITGIDVSGSMLNLGTFRALVPGESVEAVEITVPLKCHIQLDLTSSALSGDSFALLDARGEPLSLTIFQGNVAWAQESFDLIAGRSEVLTASEAGRTLVVTKDGAEVARIPVQLRAGEVNVIRP